MDRFGIGASMQARLGDLQPPGLKEFSALTALCAVVIAGTYGGLDARDTALLARGGAFFAPSVGLDARLPLVPGMVCFYLAYFPAFFAIAMLTTRDRRVMYEGTVAYVTVALTSLFVFWALPSRMTQPDLRGCHTAACAVLQSFYDMDKGFRIFPSLHVAYPTVIFGFFVRYAPSLRAPFGLLMLGIWASTVLLKRHYLADVPAGVLVALWGYAVARATGAGLAELTSSGSAPGRAGR